MIDLPFGLKPDDRMKFFIGGFDPGTGQPRALTPERLREVAEEWPMSAGTPDGIAGLLKTSRDLFIHSYFSYEFLIVGLLLSLQAVEASLRVRLASRKHFTTLIEEALSAGHIDKTTHDRLHAARKLRNEFSHPEQQTVWSLGMAGGVIESSHELVSQLFVVPTS